MFSQLKLYEYLAGALVIAAFGGFMYYKGYSGEHDKLVAFQASAKTIAHVQNKASKQKDKENEVNAKSIAHQYNHYRKSVDRMQHNSGSGKVSKAPRDPKGADGSAASCNDRHFTDKEVMREAGKLYYLQQLLRQDGVKVK